MIDHEAIPFIDFASWKMCPKQEILYHLIEIIQDKNNIVCIMSDQDKAFTQQVFDKALMYY